MLRSVKKNFAYQATWQLLLIIVPLATTPYLSRVLGPSQIGVYSYTYSVSNYFVMFAMLGISTYGVRLIALCRDDRDKRSRDFWSAYCSQLMVGVLVLFAYAAYLHSGPQGGIEIGLVWSAWVVSAVFDVSWLLFGVEEFKIPTIRSIITKIFSVIAIFIFVKGPDDLWIYCMAIAGSFLVNQILIWPFVHRYVDFVRPTASEIVRHFIPNLRLFIPVVAISLYVTLDKVMLGMMTDMLQTGYFEYSEKLSKLPLALVTAIGTVMLPRMTAELSLGNQEKALCMLDNSIWAMLAMAFAMMFGIIGIAPEFAAVFLGKEFASCDVLMCIISLTIPIIATTNVLGRQYLIPTGRDTLFTVSVVIGAVVNISVNLLLIPRFGAIGAAISSVCAEVAVLISQVVMTHRELPLSTYFKNGLSFVFCGIVMMLVVRMFAKFCNGIWGMSVQGLALEVAVGVFVFAVLALAVCFFTKDPHLLSNIGTIIRNDRIKRIVNGRH